MRLVNWLLPLAALAAYLVLILLLAPRLAAETGGLIPFDLRAFGYSHAEAQAYLTAITPAGQALYLGPIRLNDTVFPILLTLTLCLPLRRWPWGYSVPALGYGMADLAENWAVARLIQTGPQVDGGSVALASALTMLKFGLLAVAVILALAGLVRTWRARRTR
jgi:hypothetical protein